MAVIAALIFFLTLILVIWRPGKLGIGWSASLGALLALLTGVVTLANVAEVTGIVWNATLAFIAMVLVSLALEEIGFFDWASLHVIRMARGNGTLTFISVILLGAAVSAIFNNDGAILIITPIVLAMAPALNLPQSAVIPFVMACGFIADAASLPLAISNLTNIMTADMFGIGFAEYASRMVVPNLFSIAASIAVLYLLYHKKIPHRLDLSQLRKPGEAIRDRRLFRLSWALLIVLMAAYFASEWLAVPVSLVAMAAAATLLAGVSRHPEIRAGRLIRSAPWAVLFFSTGMYVVVYGLRNAGLTDALAGVIRSLADQGQAVAAAGMGLMAAFLSAVMNNLPAMMVDALAIRESGAQGGILEALVYANVIGTNLGPKMTPIGSLATLLWLHMLSRRGIGISWGNYCKAGVMLTIPTLAATLAGLILWLWAFRTPEAGAWLAWIAVVTIFALAVWAAVGLAKTRRHKKVPLSR
mgnify:CR=1 FL=1